MVTFGKVFLKEDLPKGKSPAPRNCKDSLNISD